jgi:hypothetical protein
MLEQVMGHKNVFLKQPKKTSKNPKSKPQKETLKQAF